MREKNQAISIDVEKNPKNAKLNQQCSVEAGSGCGQGGEKPKDEGYAIRGS